MKKSGIISLIALLVAVTGLLIALAAYFKRKKCVICDGFEDDIMEDDDDEYFSANYDTDSDCESCPEEPQQEPTQAEEDDDASLYEQ